MIYYGVCEEDSPKSIYAQIVAGLAEALVTQSVITSLTYRVDQYASKADAVACTSGTEITDDTALVKTSVIFDTLQTTGPGANIVTSKGTGYNFATIAPAASFPTQGYWYRIELRITPSSGDEYTGGTWVLECQARGGG